MILLEPSIPIIHFYTVFFWITVRNRHWKPENLTKCVNISGYMLCSILTKVLDTDFLMIWQILFTKLFYFQYYIFKLKRIPNGKIISDSGNTKCRGEC